MHRRLLLATNNAGKVREYRYLLKGIPFDIVTPLELGIDVKIEETGKTFQENARLKACAAASASGLLSLADDSGLEVEALGGEPGVHSARYAGEAASDSDRISYLLSRIKNVPWEKRTAHFRCVIALCQPDGKVVFCEGECSGLIVFGPKGEHGFGYDPIFYLPEFGKTMAELSLEEKSRVSHRGRATIKARDILLGMAKETAD